MSDRELWQLDDTYASIRHDGGPSITCPRCGMTSHHPEDIAQGYCGNCHDWTSRPAVVKEGKR